MWAAMHRDITQDDMIGPARCPQPCLVGRAKQPCDQPIATIGQVGAGTKGGLGADERARLPCACRVRAARRRLPSGSDMPRGIQQLDERHIVGLRLIGGLPEKIHRPRVARSHRPVIQRVAEQPQPVREILRLLSPNGQSLRIEGAIGRRNGQIEQTGRSAQRPGGAQRLVIRSQYIQRPRVALGMDRHIHEVLARRRAGGDKETETIFD